MAQSLDIDINLITRQAQANADALNDSTIGLSTSMTGLLAAVELASRALDLLGSAYSGTIGASVELESALAEVSTLYDSTAESQAQLTEEVLNFQRQFGADAVETSKAYYQAISSGAVGASNAQDLLTAANKLAVGGVTDVATSVDGLTNIMNAYGLGVESATTISDSLFIAMKAGKTTIGELASSIGDVAPNAAQLGVGFQEVLSSVSAVTTAGVKTSVAMNQLKAVFANLSKPTADLEKALRKAGISSVEASLKTDGLIGTLQKIKGTTDGSASAIGALFGSVEAGSFVVATTSDVIGKKFNSTLEAMRTAALDAGAVTEEAFNKIAETTEFKIGRLGGVFAALGAEIGDSLKPAFNGLLEIAITVGEELTRLFQENKEQIVSFATTAGLTLVEFAGTVKDLVSALSENADAIAAVVAGIGIAVGAYQGLIAIKAAAALASGGLVAALIKVKVALTAALGPIGLAAAALGALAAATIYTYNNFEIVSAFALDVAKDLLTVLAPAVNFLIDAFSGLEQVFNLGVASIKLYNATILDIALTIASAILPAFESLTNGIAAVAGVFDKDLEKAILKAKDTIIGFKDALHEKVKAVKEDSAETLKNVGVTKESEARNKSLKDSYQNLIKSVGKTSDEQKFLFESQNSVKQSTEAMRKETIDAEKAIKDLNKSEKEANKTTVETSQKLSKASEEAKKYQESLKKLQGTLKDSLAVGENLTGAYRLIDTDTELNGIAQIEGRQKVAIAVAEAARLKSIGKAEEAELRLAKLAADARIKAIQQEDAARQKAVKDAFAAQVKALDELAQFARDEAAIDEEIRLDAVKKANEEKIRVVKERVQKEIEEENRIQDAIEANLSKTKQNLESIRDSFAGIFESTLSLVPQQLQGIFKLGEFGLNLGKDLVGGIAEGLAGVLPDIELGEIGSGLLQAVTQAFAKGAEILNEAVQNSIVFFQEGMKIAGGSLIDAATEAVNAVTNLPTSLNESLLNFGDALNSINADEEKAYQKQLDAREEVLSKENEKISSELASLEERKKVASEEITGLKDSIAERKKILSIEGKQIDKKDETARKGIAEQKLALEKEELLLSQKVKSFETQDKQLTEEIKARKELLKENEKSVGVIYDQYAELDNKISQSFVSQVELAVRNLDVVAERFAESAPRLVETIIKNLPKLFKALTKNLPKIIKTITSEIPRIIPVLTQGFVDAFKAIIPEVPGLFRAIASQIPVILDGFLQIVPELILAIPEIVAAFLEQVPAIISTFVDRLPAIIDAIVEATPQIIDAIIDNLPAIIQAVIEAIPIITSELIKATPEIALALVQGVIELIPAILDGFFPGFGAGVKEVFGKVTEAMSAAFRWIDENIFEPLFGEDGIIRGLFNWVKEKIFQPVIDLFRATFTWIEEGFNFLFGEDGIVRGAFKWIEDNIINPLFGEDGVVRGAFKWIKEKIFDPLFGEDGIVRRAFNWVKENIFDPFQKALQAVADTIRDIVDSVKSIGEGAGSFISELDPTNENSTVGKIIRPWNWAEGGIIPGIAKMAGDHRKNDTVPSLLSPGEMVIPRSAVAEGMKGIIGFAGRQLGVPAPMFNQGGMIGIPNPTYSVASPSSGSSSALITELKQMRSDLTQMMINMNVNSNAIEKRLLEWDYNGLPSTRTE